MTEPNAYDVLFLCTHNSARSIMGEVIIDYLGKGRFRGYSAGSMPATAPNPFALKTLANLKFPTAGLRSKNWDEFAKPDAPVMDFVITVCDNAANEVCPIWPGQPITAHWGVEDPRSPRVPTSKSFVEFARVAHILRRRIQFFLSLPLAKLDALMIQKQVRKIGQQ